MSIYNVPMEMMCRINTHYFESTVYDCQVSSKCQVRGFSAKNNQ